MMARIIRIAIPQLTEERRKELVKVVKKSQKMLKLLFGIFAVTPMMN